MKRFLKTILGYGNIACHTTEGKVATMVYAMIGNYINNNSYSVDYFRHSNYASNAKFTE